MWHTDSNIQARNEKDVKLYRKSLQYLYVNSKNCRDTLVSKGLSNSMVLCLKSHLYFSCHMYWVPHWQVREWYQNYCWYEPKYWPDIELHVWQCCISIFLLEDWKHETNRTVRDLRWGIGYSYVTPNMLVKTKRNIFT